jgi:hypothetical protein
MLSFFAKLWLAARQWPLYTIMGVLTLAGFTVMSLQGYRLLGDDNESTEAERGGPGNSFTGHGGGHGTFYHK